MARVFRRFDGLGKMKRRKTRAILMVHKFSPETEPEKHYHSELMLYTAWWDEERHLLGNFQTYSESHASRRTEIAAVRDRFHRHSATVSDAVTADPLAILGAFLTLPGTKSSTSDSGSERS